MVIIVHTQDSKLTHTYIHVRGTAGYIELVLVALNWLVEYLEVIQVVSGVWLHRAVSKMLTNC